MEANRFTLTNEFWRKFSAAKGFVAGWNYQVSSFIGLQQDKGILEAYWTAHKQVARLTFRTADQMKRVEYLRAEWNSLILGLKSMPRNHQGEILEDIFEPSISSLYPGGLCIFQQDSAPVTTRKRRKPRWLPMRTIHQVGLNGLRPVQTWTHWTSAYGGCLRRWSTRNHITVQKRCNENWKRTGEIT